MRVPQHMVYGYVANSSAEWLATRSGLAQRSGETVRPAQELSAYLGSAAGSVLLKLRDGRLALAMNQALIFIDPSQLDVSIPATPRFSAVEIHGARPSRVGPLALARNHAVRLPSDASAVTIRFAGDGPAPGQARFAYRIRGLVDEWVDLDAPELQLAGLPPGRHVVDVKRRGGIAVDTSPETALTVTVLPRISQTLWFRLLLAAFGLGLVGAAVAYRESTRRRREVLRRRIADDLHDDLGSRMSALALQQDLIGTRLDADSRARTEEVAERLRALSRDLRDVVWYVDASADTLPALAARAAAAARSLLPPERLTVAIAELPERVVDMDTRRHVLMIVKEALHNAQRHAPEAHVELAISMRDGSLWIGVRDDGPGIVPDPEGDGRGMSTMTRRAHEIGAELSVDSGSGEGTTVRLQVPMR